ncbi:hypothetical protein, partial [Propionibacterium sp.]|uniref:hypothetical protein n=1 Tax=Propionibacterium sp. TaxID=1977903 RepID=UPI0039E8E1DA
IPSFLIEGKSGTKPSPYQGTTELRQDDPFVNVETLTQCGLGRVDEGTSPHLPAEAFTPPTRVFAHRGLLE